VARVAEDFREIRDELRRQAEKIGNLAEQVASLKTVVERAKDDAVKELKGKESEAVTLGVVGDRVEKLVYINIAALGATAAREFIGTSPFVSFAFVVSLFAVLFTAMTMFSAYAVVPRSGKVFTFTVSISLVLGLMRSAGASGLEPFTSLVRVVSFASLGWFAVVLHRRGGIPIPIKVMLWVVGIYTPVGIGLSLTSGAGLVNPFDFPEILDEANSVVRMTVAACLAWYVGALPLRKNTV